MAVIDGLEGLEAWVEVNGQKAQEYNKPDDDGDSKDIQSTQVYVTRCTNADVVDFDQVKDIPYVLKYIEAIPDQRFKLCFKKIAGSTYKCHHLGVTYFVDNERTSIVHSKTREHKDLDWSHVCGALASGSDTDGWKAHHFKFAEAEQVSEDDLSTEQISEALRNANRYAKIMVAVYRMSYSRTRNNHSLKEAPIGLAQSIPKNALKGSTITTINKFDAQPCARPRWAGKKQISELRDPLKRPCAIFEFRYRSKEGLYQEGVLERPDPMDSMSPEELRRLARIGLNHESEGGIKRDEDDVEIKQENGETALNRKRSASSAMELSLKRYKETIRNDGKVEIDLD
ncbi:uncharacterized protein PG998_008767 [Apiospora kogelbergensis]|uniref:uncharacterized protein n=1 Tax=Apiospora kogelbergensis TaxID=1337665 RepID=UPI00312CCD5F